MSPEVGKALATFIKKHGGKIDLGSEEEVRIRFTRPSKAQDFYNDIRAALDLKGAACSNKVVTIYFKENNGKLQGK